MADRLSDLERNPRGGSDAWDSEAGGVLLTAEFFGSENPAGRLKFWDGSNWVAKFLKWWNGSAWLAKPLKHWTGSAWEAS
jgi:hypothetical protein